MEPGHRRSSCNVTRYAVSFYPLAVEASREVLLQRIRRETYCRYQHALGRYGEAILGRRQETILKQEGHFLD